MSHNIDTWTQIECSLTIPYKKLGDYYTIDYGRPLEGGDIPIEVETAMECGGIKGVLRGDMIDITSIDHCGEGSGSDFEKLTDMLAETDGTYQAVLIWEGGDSVTHLVVDAEGVEDRDVDIPALIKENAELRDALQAQKENFRPDGERWKAIIQESYRYREANEHLRAALESLLADCAAVGVEPFSAAAARLLLEEPRDA